MSDEKVKKLLLYARLLSQAVVNGYENDQQNGWPEAKRTHKCAECYKWAIGLRDAVKEAETP